jgi:AraC family transcriptional regulator
MNELSRQTYTIGLSFFICQFWEEQMGIETMGDRRRDTCQVHGRSVETPGIVVERRTNGAGSHPARAYPCNELIVMLSGHARVRRSGDGVHEQCFARAGTIWTGPIGFFEKAELSKPIDCVHLCLPSGLVDRSALLDFDIDSSRIEMSFAGGFIDPLIQNLAQTFWSLSKEQPHPIDRLFVDCLTSTLVAHVIRNYTIDRWKPKPKPRALDTQRLKRVLDYIDANLGQPLSLDQLAAEACLSPFHFSRLFRVAVGLSPQRYVSDQRVSAAKRALTSEHASLIEIAVEIGFGSLDNFIRVFRKSAGTTPARYRRQICGEDTAHSHHVKSKMRRKLRKN